MKHQHQKRATDARGVERYVENKIVAMLVHSHQGMAGGSLNDLCIRVQQGEFEAEDYNQVLQLIGYSVDGYQDARLSPDAGKVAATITRAKEIARDAALARETLKR